MNIEKAKKWSDALRSGKYKQCHNTMKDGNSYCCLGVAFKEILDNKTLPGSISRYDSVATVLQFGLNDEAKFIRMNDQQKKSFPEIADYIDSLILKATARTSEGKST